MMYLYNNRTTTLALALTLALCGCSVDITESAPEPPEQDHTENAEQSEQAFKATIVGSTACFDWSCNPVTLSCLFNATCSSTDSGSFAQYHWDFGDGTTHTSNTLAASHQYTNRAWAQVNLTISMNGNEAEPDSSCRINIRNVYGPPGDPHYGTCEGLSELALAPVADAFVAQDNANTNYGNSHTLRVRHTATGFGRYAFLKFQVPAAVSHIESADLELRTRHNAIGEMGLYRLNNMSWTETGVTWNNWLGPNTSFDHLESVTGLLPNQWYALDVTSSTGPGAKTFALASSINQGGLDLYSRESSHKPLLRIRFQR